MSVHVVILAAGQGSRMKSSLPKVLHTLAGKPLLHHVIDSATALDANGLHIVVGHGAELVRNSLATTPVHWALQEQQLGTGHAVAQAMAEVPDDVSVLILYGDVPLIATQTLKALLADVDTTTLALLTVALDNPTGYGRIVRNAAGLVERIVEQKDASEAEQRIKEINTGIMAVSSNKLKQWLPRLSNTNAQGEYYLTDIIAMAVSEGMAVKVTQPRCEEEVMGVNNRQQLAHLERWFQKCQAERLMAEGATIIDPARLDIRGEVSVGRDVFIDVNAVFSGKVQLGNGVTIGPNCVITDTSIGDGTEIKACSVIEGAILGSNTSIGPFARIRPGTHVHDEAKIGNFVETKKSVIGKGSKISHLSYVGDAELGVDVNIGAGTITCNYDGVNKFNTVIGDKVFVGSNTSLVAPVTLGADCTIGAGSTITKDVEAGQLAVARGKQRNIDGWDRPVKQ